MAGKAHSLKSTSKTRKTEVFGSINLHRKQHLWVVLSCAQSLVWAPAMDPSTAPRVPAQRRGRDASERGTGGHSQVL